MKRIALFLDGTWNTAESETNVLRLSKVVAPHDGAIAQHVYYDPGVGTGRLQAIRGGALGFGLSTNVLEAYDFLVKNYEDGDEIYLFGFSRGAYTARSVAGFIAKCGLLRRDAEMTARQLYERYQLAKSARPIYKLDYLASIGEPLTDEEMSVRRSSRRIPVHFMGVWDTVGSLGVPFGNIPGLSRKRYLFHHTRLSNLFRHAYHALAIDEHRADFRPALWTSFTPHAPGADDGPPSQEPQVEQRWFPGAHADVGGGCPSTLSRVALEWLASKASNAGLHLEPRPILSGREHRGAISDSYSDFMWGLYRLLKLGRRFYRTIEAPAERKTAGTVETVHETIDGSVFERYRSDANDRPPSLQDWSKRVKLDPRTLRGAVVAKDGRPA